MYFCCPVQQDSCDGKVLYMLLPFSAVVEPGSPASLLEIVCTLSWIKSESHSFILPLCCWFLCRPPPPPSYCFFTDKSNRIWHLHDLVFVLSVQHVPPTVFPCWCRVVPADSSDKAACFAYHEAAGTCIRPVFCLEFSQIPCVDGVEIPEMM